MKKKYRFTKDDLKVTPFDISEHLDNEEMITGYLKLCLEDPDPNVFLAALGDVAKARGMTRLAQLTGLSRESLYKVFAMGRKPQFATVLKILNALDIPFTIKHEEKEASPSIP